MDIKSELKRILDEQDLWGQIVIYVNEIRNTPYNFRNKVELLRKIHGYRDEIATWRIVVGESDWEDFLLDLTDKGMPVRDINDVKRIIREQMKVVEQRVVGTVADDDRFIVLKNVEDFTMYYDSDNGNLTIEVLKWKR